MSGQNKSAALSKWKLLDDSLLKACKVWDLRLRRYRHPRQGSEGNFYYLDSRDWVIVIARTVSGELVLIRQFRCGTDSLSWEFPGGIIDKDEDPVEAGLRELREETGYKADRGTAIGHCRPNPAILNNHCYFVFADGVELSKSGPDWDEHEEIEVRVLAESEVFRWARECTIGHALALTGLLYYRLNLKNQ